jgi:hypothetical protein
VIFTYNQKMKKALALVAKSMSQQEEIAQAQRQ